MQNYACINCGRLVTEKNTMCLDCKTAYKKGLRNMWEAMKLRCDENFFNEDTDTTECHELVFEVAENGCEHVECKFNNCPIAQKLLKAVK